LYVLTLNTFSTLNTQHADTLNTQTHLALQPEGLKEMEQLVSFYKENAAILRTAFEEMGFKVGPAPLLAARRACA